MYPPISRLDVQTYVLYNYVGVAIIDSEAGVINLLYGSDGFEVDQNISSKSINTEYPFLEVYLKIITMGLLKNLNI